MHLSSRSKLCKSRVTKRQKKCDFSFEWNEAYAKRHWLCWSTMTSNAVNGAEKATPGKRRDSLTAWIVNHRYIENKWMWAETGLSAFSTANVFITCTEADDEYSPIQFKFKVKYSMQCFMYAAVLWCLHVVLHFQAECCFAVELPHPNQSMCVSERPFSLQPRTHQFRHQICYIWYICIDNIIWKIG